MSGKRQSLTYCAAAMALLAMIPAASKPPAREPSASAIEFQVNSFDLDGIGWLSEQAGEDGVDMNVNGLCAIDKDVAYLFGGVGVAAGTLRSFMLQTADGGKTWHEVMPPVLGSELTNVAFSDRQHGWAWAMWAVEGAFNAGLFSSRDGGKTWRRLYENLPEGYLLSMAFTSALNGEIVLMLQGESTSADDTRMEIETRATHDGGVTWSRARRETGVQSPLDAPEARDDHCPDRTNWELVTPAAGESIITVRRFDRGQKHWRVTTLPRHFQYRRGRVVSSP